MVIRFIVASAAVDTAMAAKAAMQAIRALVFVIENLPSKSLCSIESIWHH
jgi:hypothetical protein